MGGQSVICHCSSSLLRNHFQDFTRKVCVHGYYCGSIVLRRPPPCVIKEGGGVGGGRWEPGILLNVSCIGRIWPLAALMWSWLAGFPMLIVPYLLTNKSRMIWQLECASTEWVSYWKLVEYPASCLFRRYYCITCWCRALCCAALIATTCDLNTVQYNGFFGCSQCPQPGNTFTSIYSVQCVAGSKVPCSPASCV